MKQRAKTQIIVLVAFVATALLMMMITFISSVTFNDSEGYAEADYGMRITDMKVQVEWNNDRSCNISEKIETKFIEPSHGIYIDIPVNSGEKIRNLSVTVTSPNRMGSVPYEFDYSAGYNIVRIIVGDENILFYSGHTMVCNVKYDYLTPVHPDGENILDLNAIGYGWTCPIDNATVSVTFPSAPKTAGADFGVWASEKKLSSGDITVSNGGKTYTVSGIALDPFNGIRFKYEMDGGVLISRSDFEGWWTIIIGAIIVAAILVFLIFMGHDKPLTPVLEFYPPYITAADGRKRRMLPVQMGKIIDGTCSDTDVTSLIFYWASEGYLDIEESNGKTYFIKKCDMIAPPPPTPFDGDDYFDVPPQSTVESKQFDPVTPYEKKMFDALFDRARPTKSGALRVCTSDLSGRFASNIAYVKNAVNNEYRGKLYKKSRTVLAVFSAIICAVFGVLNATLCTLRIADGFFFVMGFLVALPVILTFALGVMLCRYYNKFSPKLRTTLLVVYFVLALAMPIALMVILPNDAMGWIEKAFFGIFMGVAAALSPFITKRTEFYTEELNSIMGFRDFLRDAEKERLEMLLKEDPQYYYNILPYANVLGVSQIWEDKFKGLAIEPPKYYRCGRRVTMFDVYILSRLHKSIGSSLTYVPPGKSNGGSFSGGGRGGHGGHGGGFGGGGGGRW